jgi:hypothetical protein
MICFEDEAFKDEIAKLLSVGLPKGSTVHVRQLLISYHTYEIRVETGERETRFTGTYIPSKVAKKPIAEL